MDALQTIGIPLVAFGVIAAIIIQTEPVWSKWEIMKEVKAERAAKLATRV
ncbi:MAG: hypothetical protein FWE23_00635 [Chitinivibrionia bacterium]|nr:hypothetical protein [Chitinivibrionia bacterium]